jgi:hypothetical protein
LLSRSDNKNNEMGKQKTPVDFCCGNLAVVCQPRIARLPLQIMNKQTLDRTHPTKHIYYGDRTFYEIQT